MSNTPIQINHVRMALGPNWHQRPASRGDYLCPISNEPIYRALDFVAKGKPELVVAISDGDPVLNCDDFLMLDDDPEAGEWSASTIVERIEIHDDERRLAVFYDADELARWAGQPTDWRLRGWGTSAAI